MEPRYDPAAVAAALSAPRLAPFVAETDGDLERALRLYEWSIRMAAAAFEVIAHVEVAMRNSIDRSLATYFHDASRGIPWLLCTPPLDGEAARRVADTRARLQAQGPSRDTRDQLVSALPFGFWSGMLGSRYEELWRSALRHAFPGSDGTRKQVVVQVEGVRKFRNRLAHHDSVLRLDIPFEMRKVRALADLLGPHVAAWIAEADRTDEVYAARPAAATDTVVVAARHAWPLYLQERAYVCQAGRWFRPVERIAFYADQEIKNDVPLILARHDNVTWTEESAGHLEQSSDRTDRKIARIIRASRAAGWTEGTYQVFNLTAPGDSRHRTLPGPLPHVTAGRGSAFTQRQRYVTLHALETARSTTDLAPATQ